MYMKKETEKMLNEVVYECFFLNAKFDLVAYWLDKNDFVQSTEIFHHQISHKTPLWADEITTFMAQEGAYPVRLGLETQDMDLVSLENAFGYAKAAFDHFEEKTLSAIDLAELNGDTRVKIFLENFIIDKNDYLKQMNILYNKAKALNDQPEKFDKYFESFIIVK